VKNKYVFIPDREETYRQSRRRGVSMAITAGQVLGVSRAQQLVKIQKKIFPHFHVAIMSVDIRGFKNFKNFPK